MPSRRAGPVERWLGTTIALAAAAWLLWSTGPALADLRAAAADPQGLVDRAGADALVLVGVPVLAWACWLWAVVGLLLTAASLVPGALGRSAAVLVTAVLPAGARRAAAAALGIGLSVAAPLASAVLAPSTAVASAAPADGPTSTSWVDWPTEGGAVPDWPGSPAGPVVPADGHVVVHGDCLWDIAVDRLARSGAADPTAAAVQDAVRAWWQANADVIGPDPDLLLPGQVLQPPA